MRVSHHTNAAAIRPAHFRAIRQITAFALALMCLIAAGCAGGWQGPESATPNSADSITSPQNQTVTVGQTATFSVIASGAGPFTYQWYENNKPITGATSATYTTSATIISDNGAVFAVVVTDPSGVMTSSPATLTVDAIKPAITAQPASTTVNPGQPATFTVVATGTGPLSYQ
jgi:hypothetical protein